MKYNKMTIEDGFSVIPDELLVSDLLSNIGNVLIICENNQKCVENARHLHLLLPHTRYIKRDNWLYDSLSNFSFKSSSNYLEYYGGQYSSIYVIETKPRELLNRLITRVR